MDPDLEFEADAPERRGESHLLVVPASHAGERLDRFLSHAWPDLSRSQAKRLIEAGQVWLLPTEAEGRLLDDPAYLIKDGETFRITRPDPEPAEPQPQAIPLNILYEDADLIVIDKPASLAVHPAPGTPDRTLVNALLSHCGKSLSGIGGVLRPGIVHRLDKDTSGLMVVAKNDLAHQHLSRAFAERRIERAYWAVVWGVPHPSNGEVSGHIGRHPVNRKKMAVLSRGGKPALTYYKIIRPLGLAASLLECRLATGRTHQIRVHLASIGHAIIGDPVYGQVTSSRLRALEPKTQQQARHFPRQALHAVSLGFHHPRNGEWLEWHSNIPNDIKILISNLEYIKKN